MTIWFDYWNALKIKKSRKEKKTNPERAFFAIPDFRKEIPWQQALVPFRLSSSMQMEKLPF